MYDYYIILSTWTHIMADNTIPTTSDSTNLGDIFGSTTTPVQNNSDTTTPPPVVVSTPTTPNETRPMETPVVNPTQQPVPTPVVSTPAVSEIPQTPTVATNPPVEVPPQASVSLVQAEPISVTPAPTETQTNQPQATPPAPITQNPQVAVTPPTTNSTVNTTQTPLQQTPTPVVPPVITIKKWSKISPVAFGIGCGLFGFIVIWAISGILYMALQNPDQFKGIIGIDGIRSGLRLFTGLFFWLLFLGGFVWGIFNLYKLITTKTGSKIKYVLWIIISVALLSGSVFGWISSFRKINELIDTSGANNSLLLPYIQFKDKQRYISEWYPIIAPTKISYGVNEVLLQRFISTNFSTKTVNTLVLDCGNDRQKLNYNASLKQFDGQCLYTKKWDYMISLITNTTDKSTNITTDEVTQLGPLAIVTEISITPSVWEITFNDAGDEIIIGKAPTKLEFNSDKIFSDLKLDQYNIKRDLDDDGVFDRENTTIFSRQFRKPQVQKIYYTLPDIGTYGSLIYEIDFRVQQNDVPICIIDSKQNDKTLNYTITTSFDDTSRGISSYLYQVKNLSTGKSTPIPWTRKNIFDYTFAGKGDYVITLEYLTDDGKKWNCESDTIEVWSSSFNVNYSLSYKWPNDSKWESFNSQASGQQISLQNDAIISRVLPARIQIKINSIVPQSSNTQTEVMLDNQKIQTPDGATYELTLQNATHEQITITVNDAITKASSTITIPITIIQKDIIGELQAFPDTVGTSPFEVTLDASTTTLTDKDDEIIYFSWDYGDGKKLENSSQARTTHTYTYNDSTDSGTYNPSVTITTKKWKKTTFSLNKPILVKKPAIVSKIIIESHPAQIADVGESVQFTLETDGNINKIQWDFGNGEQLECEDRSCANVPMFFYTAGTYTIKATTTYRDMTTSIATTKLIVNKE